MQGLREVKDRAQLRRAEVSRDLLDRKNEKLGDELRATRKELELERTARNELLDTLKAMPKSIESKPAKPRRRGRLLRVLVIAGGAYVLGAKAGRERYEQIRDWAAGLRDRTRDATSHLEDTTTEVRSAMSSDGGSAPDTGVSGV
jgi:hypothetical protein